MAAMNHGTLLKKCISQRVRVIVIGTSAGGIDALKRILPTFKETKSFSVAVVIHLPPRGPNLIPELFKDICSFKVKEAESGEAMQGGYIYFSPADYHLSLESSETLSLSSEEPLNFSRPSIDILFDSAAYSFKTKALGLLLTGANNDGTAGLMKIQNKGGICLIQDPNEAEFPTMPATAAKNMTADALMNINQIKSFFEELCRSRYE
jgi:two-component system chemotaxis response regulator CheB